MTQPFRNVQPNHKCMMSKIEMVYCHDQLLLKTNSPYECLSNAIWNGGWVSANHFLHWKVPLDFMDENPENAIAKQVEMCGLVSDKPIVLLTAAKLTHASIHELEADNFSVFCLVTAGTSNAVRAGRTRQTFPSYIPGTVNITVLIDAKMTQSAIVNAMITITEAKTAAIQDAGIVDGANGLMATGTTTDAVVVGCSQAECWPVIHRYAGTATDIGHAIETIVYRSVLESVLTQQDK